MSQSSDFRESPANNLLAELLEPLLEDFTYWFGKSLALVENHRLEFIAEDAQQQLRLRLLTAQQEVQTAKMLFTATGKQVGLDVQAMLPWHNLLMECQAIGMRYRQSQQKSSSS